MSKVEIKKTNSLARGGVKYQGCKLLVEELDGQHRMVVCNKEGNKRVDQFIELEKGIGNKLPKMTLYVYSGSGKFKNMTQEEFVKKYCISDKIEKSINGRATFGMKYNKNVCGFIKDLLYKLGKDHPKGKYLFMHEKHCSLYMIYATGLSEKDVNNEKMVNEFIEWTKGV